MDIREANSETTNSSKPLIPVPEIVINDINLTKNVLCVCYVPSLSISLIVDFLLRMNKAKGVCLLATVGYYRHYIMYSC